LTRRLNRLDRRATCPISRQNPSPGNAVTPRKGKLNEAHSKSLGTEKRTKKTHCHADLRSAQATNIIHVCMSHDKTKKRRRKRLLFEAHSLYHIYSLNRRLWKDNEQRQSGKEVRRKKATHTRIKPRRKRDGMFALLNERHDTTRTRLSSSSWVCGLRLPYRKPTLM
jgi:hypothetical protein